MMENGVANQSDRESMEVNCDARQKEIELKAARSAYGKMLAALIGRPDAGAFVLEVPSIPERPSLPPVINRPELRALDAQKQSARIAEQAVDCRPDASYRCFLAGRLWPAGVGYAGRQFQSVLCCRCPFELEHGVNYIP